MNKKRILFVIPSFYIGGTIVSLNSLLSIIDTSKYEIDVFALNRSGEYLKKLPNCNILPENKWLSFKYYGNNIINKLTSVLVVIIRLICSKIKNDFIFCLYKKGAKEIGTDKYDTVVSFAESISMVVCHYPAKNKIAWIHCDYGRYLNLLGNPNEVNVYSKFDKIVCVSEYSKLKFIEIFPLFADKTLAIHNIINIDDIKYKAMQTENLDGRFDTSFFTIVSLGRLDPVKQFERIPSIANMVKSFTDKPFRWYIIGGSRGFETLEQKIKLEINKYQLENNVILLSEKQNVYPYLNKANLVVSTSLSESYPLVVNEAKALGIPVLVNNFASADESIQDGVNGFIVSCNEMAAKIADIIIEPFIPKKGEISDENKNILTLIYSTL